MLIAGLPVFAASARGPFDWLRPKRNWPETLRWVETEFPLAKQIEPTALAAQFDAKPASKNDRRASERGQADCREERPILLDVRAPTEFRISHLRGARLAPDLETAQGILVGVGKDCEVIVYCSVGWRSSAVAQGLTTAGYRRVYNLRGGIFAWANQGRPIYDARGIASKVHPFNDDWGRLLLPRVRSEQPRRRRDR
jgi:rhodanese-related sulfurtransferase